MTFIRVVALLTVGAAVGWAGTVRLAAGERQAAVAPPATASVEIRDIGAVVEATGVVRPAVGAQVAVGSRISGILRRLHVTVGDRVAPGQLLAELDRRELETQLERASAALANAAADRAFAERELERTRQLVAREVGTGVELSRAETLFETARAREREASATVAAAQVQLEYTRISAPIGGVVGAVSTQEGETVAASFAAPTFVTIVDLDRLEVWAYVDETDVGRVAPGQRVRFTVDTYGDEEFGGRVSAVRPTAEVRDGVVNYITLIRIDSTGGRTLRPEMTASVVIDAEVRPQVAAVPNGALRRDASGTFVLLAGGERRDVTTGLRGSEYTEIASGLRVDERVQLGPASPCTDNREGGASR